MPIKGVRYQFSTYVRDKVVLFSRDSINAYLGDLFDLRPSEKCSYTKKFTRGNWDLKEVSISLALIN